MLRTPCVIWMERECVEIVSEWKCQAVVLVDVEGAVEAVAVVAVEVDHGEEAVVLSGVTRGRQHHVVGFQGAAHAVARHRVVPDPKSSSVAAYSWQGLPRKQIPKTYLQSIIVFP